MAEYSVYFICNECSEVHNLGILIELDDGPVKKESIGNLYAGKELPPEIAKFTEIIPTCPNTGKLTSQENNNKVFLVPVSD